MIRPIDHISAISGKNQIQNTAAEKNDQDNMFASVFRSAIDNVKQTESDVVKAEYLLATGQLDNPAQLSIASTKSAMAVDMLIQLRNKALEAHSELMRINL